MVAMMVGARKKLTERREALLGRVRSLKRQEKQVMGEPEPDWLDAAVDRETGNFLLGLEEAERREVSRIDAALRRMTEGAWGWCVSCGKHIPTRRLKALPEASECLACAEKRC